MTMNIPFSFIAPPLLGAFIGYLTNKIAIRMLFRPLKPWYLLGIRVPMTPGIIPAKRGELALNIGRMVGSHLLTHKDIGAALSEERFQEHIVSMFRQRISEFLDQELGSVDSLLSPGLREAAAEIRWEAATRLAGFILEQLQTMLSSEKFIAELQGMLQHLSVTEVEQLLSTRERKKIYALLASLPVSVLEGEALEKQLAKMLLSSLENAASTGKRLDEILPPALIEVAADLLREKSPLILEGLTRLIARPVIRDRIIAAVQSAIEKFIASLGPLGAMAGGFLDREMIAAKIGEFLDHRKGKLRRWLLEPAVEKEFTTLLLDRLETFTRMPISELLREIGESRLQNLAAGAAFKMSEALRSDAAVAAYSQFLETSLENLCDQGRKKTGEFLTELQSADNRFLLARTIAEKMTAGLQSPHGAELLQKILDEFLAAALLAPLGRPADLAPPRMREELTALCVRQTNRLLLSEVPDMVDCLDIDRIVVDKVNSLDLLQLEGLLLSIMEEQFTYINLFGALLGFLIGLLNLILLLAG